LIVTAAKAVLLAWFLTTVAVQCRCGFLSGLRRLSGAAGLLPGWNLFSPKPIVGDVLVDARGVGADTKGAETAATEPWRPVVHPTPRRWLDTVLCDERRATKAVFDAAVAIVHLGDADVTPEVLVTRRCYLTVLHVATAVADPALPLVEFRIVHVTYADGAPQRRIVFESRPHRRAVA
jgi:hypothetical protein